MGDAEVSAFLTHLAANRDVAPSTQTTEIYTHVVKAMQGAIRSPLDDL